MGHRCQIEGSSTACFEVEGELWVKEYADGREREGRTYRVNYCPQCGQMSNPMRVLCSQLYKTSDSLSKKTFCIDSFKQDPYDKKLPTELRKYASEAMFRLIQDLVNDRTVLNHEHTRCWTAQLLCSILEKVLCWNEWRIKTPYLKFDPDWEVKVIAPFGATVARFLVKKSETQSVSVYLDCYDALGIMDEPYWEVYPHDQDGPARVLLNETDELMQKIREGLAYKEEEDGV
jgi:hypothetical protein